MRQSEFETRVHMNVTAEEYSHIEEVYMSYDLDKDEFCKMWSKMNQSRIQKAKEEAKRLEKESKLRDQLYNIINRNHDKAYNIQEQWKSRVILFPILTSSPRESIRKRS